MVIYRLPQHEVGEIGVDDFNDMTPTRLQPNRLSKESTFLVQLGKKPFFYMGDFIRWQTPVPIRWIKYLVSTP